MTSDPIAPGAPLSVDERVAAGRAVRARVPRSHLGEWSAGPWRSDPASILAAQETSRVEELLEVRHDRMGASPFSFFRGAAAVFAHDLSEQRRTGLTVQLCGDAHLANFGGFASPERNLVFDLNDFDETLPGPFEWDLQRLAASFEVAARSNAFNSSEREQLQKFLIRTYCAAMKEFAGFGHLQLWYTRLTLDDMDRLWGTQVSPVVRERFVRRVKRARSKDNLKAFDKLTCKVDGQLRFISDPPLLERAEDLLSENRQRGLLEIIADGLDSYSSTLLPDRRLLLRRYRFVDLARKVVGVGSVGTRCWVALLIGSDEGDPLFLQVKEAQASVLEPYLGTSSYAQHGQRVVEGQRLMQSASDVFLGWDRLEGIDGVERDYYFRQLWDWKASADVDSMAPEVMNVYARMCGYTLARSHARTGDAVAIAAYVGSGATMARAVGRFASTYADQNERDHSAFVAARLAPA